MARKEARIFTSIWQDADFVALKPEAQRMYFVLLSQPELSLCGRLTLAENQWALTAGGMTRARVRADMIMLATAQPRPFILTDYATDEVLIRSFIRRDHVLQSPKLVTALVGAVTIVRSAELRRAIRDELQAALDGPLHPSAAPVVEDLLKVLSSQADRVSIPYPPKRDRVLEKGVGVDLTEGSASWAVPATDVPGARDDVDRLCEHLADRIEQQTGKRPNILKRWRTSARLLLDTDHRTEAQVHAAIDWCQDDEFWRANILSMPKLREKYVTLRLKAQSSLNGRSTTNERVQQALDLASRYAQQEAMEEQRKELA